MAAKEASSLAAALVASTAAADRAAGRRDCTRILAQLKRAVLPGLSREDCLQLLMAEGGGIAVDGGEGGDGPAAIAAALLFIANNTDDFPTEGHREAGVEILKGLFRRAFGGEGGNSAQGDDARIETQNAAETGRGVWQTEGREATLLGLWRQYAQLFERRMSRCQPSSSDSFHPGTATELAEPSEHIRLLLVELLLELGGYCLAFPTGGDNTAEGEGNATLEATSIVCRTLTTTLLDPCPEVQRAACALIEVLARLCPRAVRMTVASLLEPLTGKANEIYGPAGQMSESSAVTLAKKCLFRHRHSKTRCKAVEASVAIVLCCPREGGSDSDEDAGNEVTTDSQTDAVDCLSSYGSRASSMEQALLDTLLPAWEDLLTMDASASVQLAVLKCLGKVADALSWKFRPSVGESASEMDLSCKVEARVLALLFTGMAAGNVAEVRSYAIQNLSSLQTGTVETSHLPRDVLVTYFQHVLELTLDACSRDWAPCQSKARSLESLQVLLSVAIPLMEGASPESTPASVATVQLSSDSIRSIVAALSNNILSEEKNVLEAALAGCCVLGSNDCASKTVVDIASTFACGDTASGVPMDEELQQSPLSIGSSPRQLASILLILDGIMKGCLCNADATTILQGIDPNLTVPEARWFPCSAATISAILCNSAITDNVASNGALAWALLDACGSFVQCSRRFSHEEGSEWRPSDEVTISILVSMVHLLGCPGESGISGNATSILEMFSASQSCANDNDDDETSSLMDVHFRGVLQAITQSAPAFPWKQTYPSFLAMDALLRACSGFTVGSNFDLVAPFFITHLSTAAFSKSEEGGSSGNDQSLTDTATAAAKDELAEEYSLRIALMALLQTILADKSFSQTLSPREKTELGPAASSFSAQFTTDVLLSLVLPNLVWKAGGMAAALRKLAAATLFSLLSHYQAHDGSSTGLLHAETATHLIPILHSNLEDTESTTRELSCVCLCMVLEQVSPETFQAIWETNARVIDTLHPRLLALLDDSHDPVRMAACKTILAFLKIAHATTAGSSFELGNSALENIASTLLVQLDDPDEDIRESVLGVVSAMLLLYRDERKVIEMMEHHLRVSVDTHRDGEHLDMELELSTMSNNETELAVGALCRDSTSYRNPFNGHNCSEHDERACTEWKDVLDQPELDELLRSCPESCDLVSECMNVTRPNLFGTPSASYLEEPSSKAPGNSAGVAVLWAFGLLSLLYVGYKVYRYRNSCKGGKDEESGTDGAKRDAIHCCNSNESSAFPVATNLPTPRWLPELNISVDTDSSEGSGEGAHHRVLSNVSFGEVIVLSPTNYMLSKRLEEKDGADDIRSPSGSVTIVHLLGAMRSYEEESDEYTVSTNSP
ncbi:hypothetical protein ACHAXT_005489 [Thalassiosira profunda]